MKRALAIAPVLLLALLPAAAAQDFEHITLTFAGLQKDFDTDSSKFLEYRDIPQGAVLPAFRFQGRKGDVRYDLQGLDVTQKDQRYFGLVQNDSFRLQGTFTGIPHNFGNGGRSLLAPLASNEWRLSDTVQQQYQAAIGPPSSSINYTFLSGLVQPGLNAAPAVIDLKLQRNRSNLSLDFTPGNNRFASNVTYLYERRSGTRAANGTSFGFGNVVETPEPLRYITQDVAFTGSYTADWGTARAGLRFNGFRNSFDAFTWDNPFRVTDATDSNAYNAPGSSSTNGPVAGRTSLPPDNTAVTESVGATVRLGSRTRLTADLAFGQWRQNEDPFIAFTTNTAIRTPSGLPAATAPLPATHLDGKVGTTSLNAFVTSRLSDDVGLHVRYRRYDRNNDTPQYRFEEGYVRFDSVWEEIPRISVPYGYTTDVGDAYVTYGRGALGLEAGFKLNAVKRTFRETEKTTENTFRGAADWRGGNFALRGVAEFGSRDFDGYDAAGAEEASFLPVPGEVQVPANQTVLRRYDQAQRDLVRLGATVDVSPASGKFGLFASYFHTRYNYNQDPVPCQDVELVAGQAAFCPGGVQAPLGLVHDAYDTFTVEATLAPTERVSSYVFYSYEDGDAMQTGRQSGGTLDFNPLNVWTSAQTNKGNTVGAGLDYTLVPEKWFLGVFVRYQKVDGNNDVFLQPGYSTAIYSSSSLAGCTQPGSTCAIPAFDDTKWANITGTLRYQFARKWSAGAGVGFEDYEIDDSQTGNTLNYMPSSFFLQANNRDYRAWVASVGLTYSN